MDGFPTKATETEEQQESRWSRTDMEVVGGWKGNEGKFFGKKGGVLFPRCRKA